MNTIGDYIDERAKTLGDKTFLFAPDTDRELSFSALKSSVNTMATKLNALGISSGQKVGFMLNNGYWATQVFLGVMASNRIVVPLNLMAGATQLTYVLNHSDAEIVFVAPQHMELLEQLLASIEREILIIQCAEASGPKWPDTKSFSRTHAPEPELISTAILLYTSGSTGLPKGAIISHRAVISGAKNVMVGHKLTQADRALCVLPIFHINGAMVTVCAPLVSGGSVVMPERFSASVFWKLVATYQCTWSSIVPTIIKYLLDKASDEAFNFGKDNQLACFRFARSATSPLPAIALQQWENTFKVPMIETLGLTETTGTVSSNPMPPLSCKPGSVGLAVGNEIAILDKHGIECAANTPGEIAIRGDNLLDKYYKNPEETDSSFDNGWFRSGDLGLKDDDGFIFITGRLKELIIRGGENIAPREIDDVLYQHESILEAATVGVDNEDYGQEVVACVVLREGFSCSEPELKAFCETAVGQYKAPKNIYFLQDLPKGPSGKILRLKLPGIIENI